MAANSDTQNDGVPNNTKNTQHHRNVRRHRDQLGKFYSHANDYRLQPDQRLGWNVGDDHRNQLYRGEECDIWSRDFRHSWLRLVTLLGFVAFNQLICVAVSSVRRASNRRGLQRRRCTLSVRTATFPLTANRANRSKIRSSRSYSINIGLLRQDPLLGIAVVTRVNVGAELTGVVCDGLVHEDGLRSTRRKGTYRSGRQCD